MAVTSSTPDLSELLRAQKKIQTRIHKTPIQSAHQVGEKLGAEIFLKCENLQKTGSFKVRGALHKLTNLDIESRSKGVIAVSAGNHGQALAWASKLLNVPCTIVMPNSAPEAKVNASRGYGANVILQGSLDEAFEKAQQVAHDSKQVFVHPFDDVEVILGQGTIGLEIMHKIKDIDIIIAGVGGGGLVSGLALAAKAVNPKIKVYGVEPIGASSMRKSLDDGKPVKNNPVDTIADGLGTSMAGDITFDLVQKYVDDVVTVTDQEIGTAIKVLLSRYKLLTEPAGAASFAALYHNRIPFNQGDKIFTILSGGNTDLERLKSII